MMDGMNDRDRERLDRLERLIRDIEVDVAAIIQELRVNGLPQLLRDRPAHVGHRSGVVSPETAAQIRRTNAARARASKTIGRGRGAVRDPDTKRKLRRQAEDP